MDCSRGERWPEFFERAPRYLRRRWPGLRDAAEYLGRGLARSKTLDCLCSRCRRRRRSDAAANRSFTALGIPDGSHFFLAVVSHVVLYGRRQPLPFSQHRSAIARARVIALREHFIG